MALANRKIGYDEVVTRDIHFDMTEHTVARHWFNGDPWTTHWMNGILAAVPDGERWVMNSARRQLDKLDDPGVRKAAIEFIRQERIHAREHDVMNDIGTKHGVPIDKLEGVNIGNTNRMPFGGPFLDQATIDTVKTWIAQGALNN